MKKLFFAAALFAVASLSYAQSPAPNMGTSPAPDRATDNFWLKLIEKNTRTSGGSSGAVAQGSTTSGQSGNLTQGAVTTSAPTYTTGQTSPLSLDTSGNLRVTGTGGGAVTIADGANTTFGSKADAKSTATDTTAITAMQVLKQISASVQAPPSQAVTNAGTFAVQTGNLPTTVDTNSGTKSASTLRVVLATDQPALTNKLLVTPDSVALPANQSVNVAQVNGVTTLMGAGATGTGSQRITPATPATIATGQVTASGSAATLVAANTTRAKLTVNNEDATNAVFVGPATVTSANGVKIPAGQSRVFIGATLLQVIAPAGSPVVDFSDESY